MERAAAVSGNVVERSRRDVDRSGQDRLISLLPSSPRGFCRMGACRRGFCLYPIAVRGT